MESKPEESQYTNLRLMLIEEWGLEEFEQVEQLARSKGMTLREYIDA